METWQTLVQGDTLSWLLDPTDPAVRHLALLWLKDCAPDDPDVVEAQARAMESHPIKPILDLQRPDGSWQETEQSYNPMYRSSIWQIIFLAELGADGADERVRKGAEHVLTTTQDEDGTFPAQGQVYHGALLCVNAMALNALLLLGYAADTRVQKGVSALVGLTRKHGARCRYNADLPCAWAAAKTLKALAAVPAEETSFGVAQAVDVCAELLLSADPSVGDYPTKSKPSPHWRRLAVPRGFQSDVLEVLEGLALVGRGQDPALVPAIQYILSRQNAHGRWPAHPYLNGKMLVDWEQRGQDSKWVTLHAARTLRLIVG